MSIMYKNVKSFLNSSAMEFDINKNKLLAASIGMAVAYRFALPTTKVDNPLEWYNSIIINNDYRMIDPILENLVVKSAEVDKWLKTFWFIRYNVLHPAVPVEATMQEIVSTNPNWVDLFLNYSNVREYISKDDLALISEANNSHTLYALFVLFQPIIDSIVRANEK